MNVDVHAHGVPRAYLEQVGRGQVPGVRLEKDDQGEVLAVQGDAETGPVAQRLRLAPECWDVKARVAAMDAARIDVQVVSPFQFMFHYWLSAPLGVELARLVNDGLGEMVAGCRRLVPMATLPLQSVDAAIAEIERVHHELGIRTVEIGTHVAGTPLDADVLAAFWARAEALGTIVFVHPYAPAGRVRLDRYFLRNLLGNPFETTVAVSRLVFGGVLERFPGLRLYVAHGGGALPYLVGRLERGYDVDEGCRRAAGGRPGSSMGRLYYDTITHDTAALEFLIARVGASRVLMGSDYPFEIGDPDPVRTVQALAIDDGAKKAVLGDNATSLFGLA